MLTHGTFINVTAIATCIHTEPVETRAIESTLKGDRGRVKYTVIGSKENSHY